MQLFDNDLNIVKIQDVKKIEQVSRGTSQHHRPTDCFLYGLSGSAYYTFHGKTVKIEKGDVIFFSRVNVYKVKIAPEGFSAIYVNCFLEDTQEPLCNEIFKPQNSTVLDNSFKKLLTLWKTGNFSDRIHCKSLLYRIYAELANQMQYKYIPSGKKEKIESAVNFMTENISDTNFSVEKLGPMCQMSQVHFRRIFSQIYHTTPVAFLVSLRINKAKELLHASSLSIAEIATQCGFSSTHYFSTKFRDQTGLTPTEFKKTY